MKTSKGQIVKVRVLNFKWHRNYGGRSITTIPYIVDALFLYDQNDHTYVVELQEPAGSYPKGHKIAIPEHDFNI